VGPWTFTFAVMPHAGSWERAGVLEAAEAYRHPFVTAAGRSAGDTAGVRAGGVPGLTVDGRGVALSALRRRGSALEIRVVALTDTPTEARIIGRRISAARDVDLLGRVGADLPVAADGSLRIPLGPWEIRTIRIDPAVAARRA
jgi:alpha-mannosidase